MGFLVPLALFGWIPFVLLLFQKTIEITQREAGRQASAKQAKLIGSQRAVVACFILAWLFLPVAGYAFPGIPDLTKMSATCYGILLAALIFDRERLTSLRWHWVDIGIVPWCICPLFSSLSNDLGLYDGISSTLLQTVTWGFPYLLGRMYLGNLTGTTTLVKGIFWGGLVYVPLCLYEVRMSPQLHSIVYGFFQHSFAQTKRYGGWRPVVFMQHGLEVGIWMMAAALIGVWLWRSGTMKRVGPVAMPWAVAALTVTFVLVKSTAAYGLFAIGLILLFACRQLKTALPVFLLGATMVFYLATNTITAPAYKHDIVAILRSTPLPEARVNSVEFRFDNEELLIEKARQRLVFGWGGWGRNRVYDERGNDIAVTDSLWIIIFGQQGIFGLASATAVLILPALSVLWLKCPARFWQHPRLAPVPAIAAILLLYQLDCLLNAMINPIFVLASGGLAGIVASPKSLLAAAKPRPKTKPRRARSLSRSPLPRSRPRFN